MILDEIKSGIDYRPIHETLRLYHGSKAGIHGTVRHDYAKARGTCDFGRGFYMGTDPAQAKTLICTSPRPVFYETALDMDGLRCVQVSGLAWAMLVAYHRGKLTPERNERLPDLVSDIEDGQDVIIGPIADDRMFLVLDRFFDGAITDQALIACMRGLELGTQYVAKTQAACGHIRILSEKILTEDELAAIRIKSEENRRKGIDVAERNQRRYRREGAYFDEIVEELERGLRSEPDFFAKPTM